MALEKVELRRRYLAVRQTLTEPQRLAADAEIRRYLCQLISHVFAAGTSGSAQNFSSNKSDQRVVTLYRAMRGEVDVFQTVPCIVAAGGQAAFPVTQSRERRLDFYVTSASTNWKKSPFGIVEPQPNRGQVAVAGASLVVVVVPGLAFTRQGVRLGYGGGFYDRLLAQPAVSALRVGVGYDLQWAKSLPAMPHDQPLHLMITEQGVWDCRQPPLLSPGDSVGAWEGTS